MKNCKKYRLKKSLTEVEKIIRKAWMGNSKFNLIGLIVLVVVFILSIIMIINYEGISHATYNISSFIFFSLILAILINYLLSIKTKNIQFIMWLIIILTFFLLFLGPMKIWFQSEPKILSENFLTVFFFNNSTGEIVSSINTGPRGKDTIGLPLYLNTSSVYTDSLFEKYPELKKKYINGATITNEYLQSLLELLLLEKISTIYKFQDILKFDLYKYPSGKMLLWEPPSEYTKVPQKTLHIENILSSVPNHPFSKIKLITSDFKVPHDITIKLIRPKENVSTILFSGDYIDEAEITFSLRGISPLHDIFRLFPSIPKSNKLELRYNWYVINCSAKFNKYRINRAEITLYKNWIQSIFDNLKYFFSWEEYDKGLLESGYRTLQRDISEIKWKLNTLD